MKRVRTSTAAGVLAVGLLAGIMTGCGSDEQTHTVTATDFRFEDLPETISVGDQLELRNESDTEIHELVAFRLDDGETRSIEELVALPPDDLLGLVGLEPAAVLITPPGGDTIAAVGDGVFDEPGRYGVICFIPTGADPGEYLAATAESQGGPPDVTGGPPHLLNGMFAEFTVES